MLDELEDDLTRVDDDEVLGGKTESTLLASPHALNMAGVASFAQPAPVADPVRVFIPVETDDESDNEESSPPMEARRVKRRVGGTRDQSFHGLPRPEQQDTRVVWWCFLEGRHRVDIDANPATIQDAYTEVLHHSIGTPVDSDHEADIDDDTASFVAGPGGEDPMWNEFESMLSDAPESVAGEGVAPQEEDPVPMEDITPGRALRALESLDGVDVSALMRCRAVVMKSHPKFLRGAFRSAIRLALDEANAASRAHDERRQCRAWKLFLLAPRMVLFRRTRGS